MDKPCYFYGSSGNDICVSDCCHGSCWATCGWGRGSSDFRKKDIDRLNPEEKAKLAKARRIREEIFEYFKKNFTGLIYPHVLKNKTKSAITKIIKRHL
jgi:epoxyqueuosine reductase QueG